MSPIAARKVAATITFTPGTVISRLISGDSSAALAINRSTSSISRSRKSTWRSAESTVSRSSSGRPSSVSQARPLTPKRSENGARPTRQRISTAWIWFFARERAETSWARRARRRRILQVARSGIQTASSSPEASSLASVRASSRSVFARAERIPVSLGETTTTSAAWGSRIRLISQALPVTSSATRSSAPRLRANSSIRSGVASIRPAERTAPSSEIATSQKSRWTSNPIARTCSSSRCWVGEAVGKRHRRNRALSAPG